MTRKASPRDTVNLDTEVVRDSRGRRITEARAQSIAEEVLREYYVGRPSLAGAGGVSPEIKARVPQELRDRVVARARQTGQSTSQLVRAALEQYLAS